MTHEEIISFGYTKFESPTKGTIFIKQDGTVTYIEKENTLQLPNGNKISNPTKGDFVQTYSQQTSFPKMKGCSKCKK